MFYTTNKTSKISDQIVQQIRDKILRGHLKPGDRVASEKELMEQFGVSKATLREALRVLESMDLVDIRKGAGGGAYVAKVSLATTINSIANFLHFKSVTIRDIAMVRYLIEPSVIKLVSLVITQDNIRQLEELIAQMSSTENVNDVRKTGFHRYLVRLTENPILILIIDVIFDILEDYTKKIGLEIDFYGTDHFKRITELHREILSCLVRRDGHGAAQALSRDIIESSNVVADMTNTPRFDAKIFGETDSGAVGNLSDRQLKDLLDDGVGQELIDRFQATGLLLKNVISGELYMFAKNIQKETE